LYTAYSIQTASTKDVHVHTTYSNPYQGGSRLIPFLPLLFPVTSFLHLSCFQISFHPKKLRPASTCHICRGLSVLLFFFPSFSSARRSITNSTTVCNIDRSLPLTSIAATPYQRVVSSNLAVVVIYDPIARTGAYSVLLTIERLNRIALVILSLFATSHQPHRPKPPNYSIETITLMSFP
jgi:hypothetical protein